MIEAVGASTDIYEAVVSLSRSIGGRSDLESLLSGVGEPLRRIVGFDYVGLTLHDRKRNRMQGRFLGGPGTAVASLCLPVDQDPAGWVWLNQEPLIIRCVEDETRWPEFRDRVRATSVSAVTLVPLTAGDHRLGAFGFGCLAPYEPSTAELAFLERVASEFAVAVESFLARQEAVKERDPLRTLFEITNALVSKLSPYELFSATAAQLSRVIRHDFSVLSLFDETGRLEMVGLHFTGAQLFDKEQGHINPEGRPSSPVVPLLRVPGDSPVGGGKKY